VHDLEIYSLDGVVGIKGVRDPVLTIVVSTSSYLDFISYAVALASLCNIDMDQRRRGSCVVSWIRSDVCLNVGSIGCVVGDVTSGVDLIVCWGVSTGLAGALAAALTGCATSFSPRPSSATGSRGPWLRHRWHGRSDLLLV
jgi:hypothetical protein